MTSDCSYDWSTLFSYDDTNCDSKDNLLILNDTEAFKISRIARLARALKDDGGVENMDVLGRYSLIGQLPYVLHTLNISGLQ